MKQLPGISDFVEKERYDRAQLELYEFVLDSVLDFTKKNKDVFFENLIGVCFKVGIDVAKDLGVPAAKIKSTFKMNMSSRPRAIANIVMASKDCAVYDKRSGKTKFNLYDSSNRRPI